jgi:hypothetical protein
MFAEESQSVDFNPVLNSDFLAEATTSALFLMNGRGELRESSMVNGFRILES